MLEYKCEREGTFYERICRIVAEDPDLLDLAATVPDERSTANVFSCPPDDALSNRLSDLCDRNEDDLRPLLETRRTQTNSVRRTAALYPSISHVESQMGDHWPSSNSVQVQDSPSCWTGTATTVEWRPTEDAA